MKTTRNVILGVILIIIGVALAGDNLNWFHFNIFFKGWWTLFIIVPATLGLLKDQDKKGHLIALIIGVLLLLASQKVISFDIIWELLFPIIIIVLGLSLIFKNSINKEVNKNVEKLNKKLDKNDGYNATFSGEDIRLDNEEFQGTNLNAIFGGLKLDLRKAIINEDVVINATSIFGGIDIFVPDNVKIKVKSNSIFGGTSNKKETDVKDDSKTIYINATCVFGGVEIK